MKVGIIGLGLIGGSLAMSIKTNSNHTVYGYDIDPDVITKALMCGAIDESVNPEGMRDCHIVLVALYPCKIIEAIDRWQDCFDEDALIIDCAGVKRAVFGPISNIAEKHGWTYIGGHPMAGREFSGFG